jgi:hypothetical protein
VRAPDNRTRDVLREIENIIGPSLQHDIAVSVRMINRPVRPPAGVTRQNLRKLAKVLKKARLALNPLPRDLREHVAGKLDAAAEFERMSAKAETLAKTIHVKESGGRQVSAARKRRAADEAFGLLVDPDSTANALADLTLSPGSAYFRLAALLYELATGERSSDLARACAERFNACPELRALRREGRQREKNAKR